MSDIKNIINSIKQLRGKITVPNNFHAQVAQINQLLRNDKTGIVTTVIDFMVNTANVKMKIETDNKNLNDNLQIWQNNILNRNVNIDIPGGLKALSVQYFRERWRSSFIGLKVLFEEIDFGDGKFELPVNMWFVNGGSLEVKSNDMVLDGKKYFLKNNKKDPIPLENKGNELVFIRKPFSAWYENYPTPYLVRKGVLFNALLKNAIITKQADVIEVIIPYLAQLKAGSDRLAELDMLSDEGELKALKQKIIESTSNKVRTSDSSIASLSYDVNFEHVMPDLKKVFNSDITASVDKNILAGLGLIELEGFSKTRQEAILNPKVLVEEVKDAVDDWSELLEDVMVETLRRNKEKHPKLANNLVSVMPGVIKGFMTDNMRTLVRSLYDRGVISKGSTVESTTDFHFEIEVDKRKKETEENLDEIMSPPVTQNLGNQEENTDNEVPDDKKKETPESKNFKNADLENVECKNCNYIFDYALNPEVTMGEVKCPGCGTVIDQEGNYSKYKEE